MVLKLEFDKLDYQNLLTNLVFELDDFEYKIKPWFVSKKLFKR